MLPRKILALALCLQSSYSLTPNFGEAVQPRRAFLGTSAIAFLGSLPAFADDDVSDLSMPAADQKSEVSFFGKYHFILPLFRLLQRCAATHHLHKLCHLQGVEK